MTQLMFLLLGMAALLGLPAEALAHGVTAVSGGTGRPPVTVTLRASGDYTSWKEVK